MHMYTNDSHAMYQARDDNFTAQNSSAGVVQLFDHMNVYWLCIWLCAHHSAKSLEGNTQLLQILVQFQQELINNFVQSSYCCMDS